MQINDLIQGFSISWNWEYLHTDKENIIHFWNILWRCLKCNSTIFKPWPYLFIIYFLHILVSKWLRPHEADSPCILRSDYSEAELTSPDSTSISLLALQFEHCRPRVCLEEKKRSSWFVESMKPTQNCSALQLGHIKYHLLMYKH